MCNSLNVAFEAMLSYLYFDPFSRPGLSIDLVRSNVKMCISMSASHQEEDRGNRSRIAGVTNLFLGRTKPPILVEKPTDPIDHPSRKIV